MSLIEALILGIVQGITEALPISSTAHVVIASMLLDLKFEGLAFEIFLHLASALAVIVYYRNDLYQIIIGFFSYFRNPTVQNKVHFRFGLYIIIATAITGFLGLMLQELIDESIKTPSVIALSLFVTGTFLIFIERFHHIGEKDESTMGWIDTILVAFAQTLAVLPGISRSGSTLVAGLWTGLNRETAVKFSFLLAIPVILGSTLLLVKDVSISMIQETGIGALMVAFIASFFFSLIGIIWLINFLKRSKLIYFAIYCFALAIFVFFYFGSSTVMDL
jgi:undecaprenyl-diphosphatase